MILHQIWNQRRQNFWIWLELALLSVFLWLAVDPLFTMTCVTQVPRGYDTDRLYLLRTHYDFRKREFSEEDFTPQMDHLLTRLSEHPLVEEVCLCDRNRFIGKQQGAFIPFYRNQKDAQADKDEQTSRCGTEVIAIPVREGLEKWADLPGMLRLRDATTGHPIHGRTDATARDVVYFSSSMARDFYRTLRAKDSTLYFLTTEYNYMGQKVDEHTARVEAVCTNIKICDYQTPAHIAIIPMDAFYMTCTPLVRVKEGVDEDEFRAAIERDVLPRCPIDDVRSIEVMSVEKAMGKITEQSGAYNIIRLRSVMGFFGLLCVFLGVSGLFWVRCGERRQDIGVMRSMGASRRTVKRQMLLEGTLLLTASFWVAMLFVAWYVRANGYNMGLEEAAPDWMKPDMVYWFNRPWPHVISVTLLTYGLMLLITLLGTWLPVHRATRISPCDALRDE